ncbi:MAG TPA: prepilin-type N-terminal cleavage/methylation domain-containing protein [Trueperaceae bacterium]|nr:prepilin-type N-terminal cleavage/methylation domain-containing protein [Trueperaceae bacterium]
MRHVATRTVRSVLPGSLRGDSRGLSLVEVLVALAILATVALALFGLQASGLRAARTAALTRQQAADLRFESSLARLVPPPSGTCRGDHEATSCVITTTCLDVLVKPDGCQLLRTTIEVTSTDGRTASVTTVGYLPLEAAPVGVPVAQESLP